MHSNLCVYIHDELEELDRKVKSGGKLTASELEYGDMLAHFKKSLLTNEAMEESGYSERGYSYNYPRYRYDGGMSYEHDGMSYARKRDSVGRYSRADEHEHMVMELREAMNMAKDSAMREEIKRLIDKAERM